MFVFCFQQAEESYMADEENQGNTLVSVAPLNQPEPQEKPSLNGESQEAVKVQTPPAATNGHSTTKAADTELWTSRPATKGLGGTLSPCFLNPAQSTALTLAIRHKGDKDSNSHYKMQNVQFKFIQNNVLVKLVE